jgi:tRNA (adenine37-N6)-methyltransferase
MNHEHLILSAQPIGFVRSPYGQQSGTPVQANFGECAAAEIHLYDAYRGALKDLEGFTRIWVLSWLDRSKPYELLTTPYRDTVQRGLFATRSPSRPNPIGLSCTNLTRVEPEAGVLYVKGIDLVDGTPVLDIKPYIPEVDSFPDAASGWFSQGIDRQYADGRFEPRNGKAEHNADHKMRIAIPSDNELEIAQHTGRCRGFSVYDVADGKAAKVEYRPNTFTQHHQQHASDGQHRCGHGHSHDGILSGLADCQAMIAVGMGRRLAEDLLAHNIRVLYAEDFDVELVAQKAASGQLREIDLNSLCHGHHHGQ